MNFQKKFGTKCLKIINQKLITSYKNNKTRTLFNYKFCRQFNTTNNNQNEDHVLTHAANIDFSTIYNERTAITSSLWNLRTNLVSSSNINNSQIKRGPLIPRAPWQSCVVLCLDFGSNIKLRNQYVRFDGGIRFEKILEDMDALAGNVAKLHADNCDGYEINFVTAAVDRIDMLRRFPMTIDLVMQGQVTYVGKSSLNVLIKIFNKNNSKQEICQANFIMVARDLINNKSIQINPLLIESDEEKQLHMRSEYDGQIRKQQKNERLSVKPPTSEEIELIHKFWLDRGNGKLQIDKNKNSNIVTMHETKLESSALCQPQELNRAGKIFGGYLMRHAYELARTTAYRFAGHSSHPVFAASDEITFEYPVSIGSLIRSESWICCTDSNQHIMAFLNEKGEENQQQKRSSMCVIVRTYVTEPNDTKQPQDLHEILSNVFSFTYVTPKTNLRRVIPLTYEEAMLYVFGKRSLLQTKNIAIHEGSLLAQYI